MNKIRSWFIADYLSKTEDVFDRAKIELIYSLSILCLILNLVLCTDLFVLRFVNSAFTILVSIPLLIWTLLSLKNRQKLNLAASIYIVQQTLVFLVDAFLQGFQLDISEGFWVISLISFSCFIFGTKKGLLVSSPHIVFLFLFSLGEIDVMVNIHEHRILPQHLQMLTITPYFLTIYVIAKFVLTKDKAEAEIKKQKSEIGSKNREIIDSINYARRLQQAILPPISQIQKQFPDSFLLYLPKDIVAGDFYWMYSAGDNVLIAAADCTGHGVPGALISIVCSNALNRTVKEFGLTETGKILDKVTELVFETFEKSGEAINDGMDVSLLSINKRSGQVQWSGANNPLWVVKERELTEIKADKQHIGKSEDRKPFTTRNLPLNKGETFYLITDGYGDQFGKDGKKLMKKNFKELILSVQDKSMSEQRLILEQHHLKWKGNLEQTDDVTVIAIKL